MGRKRNYDKQSGEIDPHRLRTPAEVVEALVTLIHDASAFGPGTSRYRDPDTGIVVVVARNEEEAAELTKWFEARRPKNEKQPA